MVASADAQQPARPLLPVSPGGLPVIPFMEGWYANEDGSITVSFGYNNRNVDDVTVPLGENNRLEPAQFDGIQPSIYYSGRNPGVFAVTIPASKLGESVWWHIKTGKLEELKVPGDANSSAYELDRNPRPQGSVQPFIWFKNESRGSGPEGVVAAQTKTISVGAPLTIEVHTEDPSVRDPSNPLFAKPLDSRVTWYEHQGPAGVSFTEHASTPFIAVPAQVNLSTRVTVPAQSSRVAIPAGKGPARVIATFSEPGEYIVRARVDNWKASDSDGLDQCCWSNAYQRVQVTP
tara:strand:+ start:39403 stop:40272 length:870 start_codon:yes stop_codon:yes gene_type:complete